MGTVISCCGVPTTANEDSDFRPESPALDAGGRQITRHSNGCRHCRTVAAVSGGRALATANLGLKPFADGCEKPWVEFELRLLGTATDQKIAHRLGRTCKPSATNVVV